MPSWEYCNQAEGNIAKVLDHPHIRKPTAKAATTNGKSGDEEKDDNTPSVANV